MTKELTPDQLVTFATRIMNGVCANSSGGSVNAYGDVPVKGFMVGGKTWTLTTIPENLDFYTVLDFVTVHRVALSWDSVYVGWWTHEGRVYLDVSDNVANKDVAVYLAEDRKEIAYYDVNTGVSVCL